MMIRRRLADIFSLDAAEESADAVWESSSHLRVPTIDERATLYLRAVHEKHDFTTKEISDARNLILDAMAADIIAESRVSLPEVTFPNRSENAEQVGAVPFANLEDSSPPGLASRKIVSLAHAYVTRSAGAAAASSASQAAPFSHPSRRFATRKVSIFAAAAIAAVVACFLVTVFPMSWFATKPNSFESQVAVQSLPRELEMKAEFPAAPKQVETAAGPTAAALTVTDLLIRKAPLTNQSDTEEMADLLKRGRELIVAGDIPAARWMLKQAAEAGNASAALELAATYDPIVLEELRQNRLSLGNNPSQAVKQVVKGRESDPETIARDITMARRWYQTAKDLGSAEASKRLERLLGADR
jgi:TPR repeat protein